MFDEAFHARLIELFRWRRDVRRFRRDPLATGLLEELLELASLAPSVGLSQPWRFVTVDDPARRAAVRESFEACNAEALAGQGSTRARLYAGLKLAGLDRAPCQVAVCTEADPAQGHGLGRGTMPQTVAYSAVMAIHTLWLAARSVGLGLGWVSILEPSVVMAALDLPGPMQLVAYLCLGYPEAESEQPELEAAGWEYRHPAAATLIRR